MNFRVVNVRGCKSLGSLRSLLNLLGAVERLLLRFYGRFELFLKLSGLEELAFGHNSLDLINNFGAESLLW